MKDMRRTIRRIGRFEALEGRSLFSATPLNAVAVASAPETAIQSGVLSTPSAAPQATLSAAATTTILDTSAINAVGGQSIGFTASVFTGDYVPNHYSDGPAATGATGTVTFMAGSTILGSASLQNGVARFSTSSLAAGSYSITAVYSGDGGFQGSASNAVAETVTAAATTTTLVSSNLAPAAGQPVTLTATIAYRDGYAVGPALGTDNLGVAVPDVLIFMPAGTIASSASGTVTFLDGQTVLGTASVQNGIATFTTSALAGGGDSITAVYAGDSRFTGSSSPAITLSIAGTAPESVSAAPWQNSVNPLDVLNTGGAIVPADALAVIDYLNTHGAGTLPTTKPAGSYDLDVLGTNTVTPQSALLVIDYLNLHPTGDMTSGTGTGTGTGSGGPATPALAKDGVSAAITSVVAPQVSSAADSATSPQPLALGAGLLSQSSQSGGGPTLVLPAIQAANSPSTAVTGISATSESLSGVTAIIDATPLIELGGSEAAETEAALGSPLSDPSML